MGQARPNPRAALYHRIRVRGVSEFAAFGDRLLVVYDGHCGFCNRSIRWLLRRDRGDRLRFAASSDSRIAELLERRGLVPAGENSGPGSILTIRDPATPSEVLLEGSDAVLACLRALPQPWSALAAILWLVPHSLREWGYGVVARNRYRIAGRYATCPIPTAEERAHFL